MRFRGSMAALTLVAGMAACTSPEAGSVDFSQAALESDDQKASYGIGLNVGSSIAETKNRLDRAAFMRGLEDALQGADPAIPRDEIQTVLQAFASEMQAEAQVERNRAAQDNAREGAEYLAQNGAKEGVITTESGLQYEVLREGSGDRPGPDDRARLHYRGTYIDGTEFDASYGGDPAEFAVGGVIAGFSEGIQLMAPGSHYRFVIPAEIGYGPDGFGSIPPNKTLIFEVELIEVLAGG